MILWKKRNEFIDHPSYLHVEWLNTDKLEVHLQKEAVMFSGLNRDANFAVRPIPIGHFPVSKCLLEY